MMASSGPGPAHPRRTASAASSAIAACASSGIRFSDGPRPSPISSTDKGAQRLDAQDASTSLHRTTSRIRGSTRGETAIIAHL
jgi:hypothetical protein